MENADPRAHRVIQEAERLAAAAANVPGAADAIDRLADSVEAEWIAKRRAEALQARQLEEAAKDAQKGEKPQENDPDAEPPYITAVKRRIVELLSRQIDPTNPTALLGIVQAAYFNNALVAGRAQALEELFLNPPPPDMPRREALNSALLRVFSRLATQIEAALSLGEKRIQVANEVPSAVRATLRGAPGGKG